MRCCLLREKNFCSLLFLLCIYSLWNFPHYIASVSNCQCQIYASSLSRLLKSKWLTINLYFFSSKLFDFTLVCRSSRFNLSYHTVKINVTCSCSNLNVTLSVGEIHPSILVTSIFIVVKLMKAHYLLGQTLTLNQPLFGPSFAIRQP